MSPNVPFQRINALLFSFSKLSKGVSDSVLGPDGLLEIDDRCEHLATGSDDDEQQNTEERQRR